LRSHQGKLGRVAFVIDERLSREKAAILTRVVNQVRQWAEVDVIGGAIEEDALLRKLEAKTYDLVLAPWYRYLAWSHIEAFYGLTRTSGPTFAGYFCDTVLPYEIGEQADHLRAILLDFNNLSTSEASLILRCLIKDHTRSGILPLFEPGTFVFYENWFGGQGLGLRIDSILGIPGIANSEWIKRSRALRVCFMSLWSLIYDEGPGKGEFTQAITSSTPKAAFQIAVDNHCLVMRLCYSMPSWTPRDALRIFWPVSNAPTSAGQLLTKYADFVRVHTIPEASDVEITVGFFESGASEKAFDQVHTLWIEPIAATLVSEIPFETHSPDATHLKPLPTAALQPKKAGEPAWNKGAEKAKDRFIFEAANKIRELKKELDDKNEALKELRRGGVGTAKTMAPLDAESLLEMFQEKYFESRLQIRKFQLEIADLEEKDNLHEYEDQIAALKHKMESLEKREKLWLKKIAETLEVHRGKKKSIG
jgi:hypothetical protein